MYYSTSRLLSNVGLKSKPFERETQVFPSHLKHIQHEILMNSTYYIQHQLPCGINQSKLVDDLCIVFTIENPREWHILVSIQPKALEEEHQMQ